VGGEKWRKLKDKNLIHCVIDSQIHPLQLLITSLPGPLQVAQIQKHQIKLTPRQVLSNSKYKTRVLVYDSQTPAYPKTQQSAPQNRIPGSDAGN
jgi:hypothetical protein